MSRILIVEDNESLRTLMSVLLERHGHTTVEATNGADAFALLDQYKRIDAIISDLCMPEIDGLQLLTQVKQQFPTMPVILTSAYMYQLRNARILGASRLLLKPFSNTQFIQAVDSALQQPALAS